MASASGRTVTPSHAGRRDELHERVGDRATAPDDGGGRPVLVARPGSPACDSASASDAAEEHVDVEQDRRLGRGLARRRAAADAVGHPDHVGPARRDARARCGSSPRTTTTGRPCGERGVIEAPCTEKNSPVNSIAWTLSRSMYRSRDRVEDDRVVLPAVPEPLEDLDRLVGLTPQRGQLTRDALVVAQRLGARARVERRCGHVDLDRAATEAHVVERLDLLAHVERLAVRHGNDRREADLAGQRARAARRRRPRRGFRRTGRAARPARPRSRRRGRARRPASCAACAMRTQWRAVNAPAASVGARRQAAGWRPAGVSSTARWNWVMGADRRAARRRLDQGFGRKVPRCETAGQRSLPKSSERRSSVYGPNGAIGPVARREVQRDRLGLPDAGLQDDARQAGRARVVLDRGEQRAGRAGAAGLVVDPDLLQLAGTLGIAVPRRAQRGAPHRHAVEAATTELIVPTPCRGSSTAKPPGVTATISG